MTSMSASSVRTPPAALTLTCGPTARAHQPEVVERGARWREPGRGLDVVGAGALDRLAAADDLVLGQVRVLEDDLDDRPRGMGDVGHRPDVGLDALVLARAQPADVDDHVELGRAVADRPDGLEDLGLGPVRSVREADHGPDDDVGPGQELATERDVGRSAAHRRDLVPRRDGAAFPHVVERELGSQQRVVDGLGDPLVRQVLDRQRSHAPMMAGTGAIV